jgi:hypothetical protein
MVFLAFLLMLGAFLYKNGQIASQEKYATTTKQAVSDFQEIIALKKIWADKKTSKKVEKLKDLIPAAKVTWSSKSKKVTASYKGLTASELNKLVTKILDLPVEIKKLKIQNIASSYDVEFKCKW